jgi:protein TonB
MRRGVTAAVGSLAAHVAIVGGLVWLVGDATPRVTRSTRVEVGLAVTEGTANRQAAPVSARPEIEAPRAAPETPDRKPARRSRSARASATDSAEVAEAERDPGSDSEAGSDSDSEADSDSDSAPATSSPAAAPAPAPAPALEPAPVDPDAVRSRIDRAVSYPRLARRQGLEGRVVVRFRIDSQGAPHEVAIVQSAGAILDEAARDAVGRAAPYPSTPGWVRVPVDFSLRAAR